MLKTRGNKQEASQTIDVMVYFTLFLSTKKSRYCIWRSDLHERHNLLFKTGVNSFTEHPVLSILSILSIEPIFWIFMSDLVLFWIFNLSPRETLRVGSGAHFLEIFVQNLIRISFREEVVDVWVVSLNMKSKSDRAIKCECTLICANTSWKPIRCSLLYRVFLN